MDLKSLFIDFLHYFIRGGGGGGEVPIKFVKFINHDGRIIASHMT